ncbi:hypothetical protein J7E50_03105 [Pedobacter sp. ISL-68]|uniref:hypothetical protein n=1 Tax=unclassified Pedobacter TaxID=2628915 RepID=UPI001BEBB720|nr:MULTISPECIES: hypothetical protein [unclassified Pedobacter]MBT2589189.1 hypothetical protein [Pedobacter sp. ISL-68]
MIFHEDDINFERLDWKQFEEMCYDLLVKFQFHSMAWRQGGSDNGRDIEGRRYITDSIVSLKVRPVTNMGLNTHHNKSK